MNNILFIGGAGFIGSNLLRRFVEDVEYNVFVYEPSFANVQRLDVYGDSVRLIRGTLGEFDLICLMIETHKIDTIVHLVSTLVPGSSYEDYINEFKNVVFPTVRLLTYCADNNIKFIYFSSGGTIYGNSIGEKFVEKDAPAPISYYGLTKQSLENSICFEHRRNNLRYLIIRPSNPYGRGQDLHGNQGFIAVALGKVLAGDSIEIWGNGSSIRDYIYIDDLGEAFYKLIKQNIENEIFNVGCGKGYTLTEILSVMEKVVTEPTNVVYKPSRSVDVNAMVLDVTKLKTAIGFHHTRLQDGLRIFYEEVKKKIEK